MPLPPNLRLQDMDTTSDSDMDELIAISSTASSRSSLLRRVNSPRKMTRNQCVLSTIFVGSITLILGFLSAFVLFSINYDVPSTGMPYLSRYSVIPSLNVSKFIKHKVDANHIKHYLLNFTDRPHVAGTPADFEQAQYVKEQWILNGLDTVNIVPYNVLLSYPDPVQHNQVFIISDSDPPVLVSEGRQEPLHSPEESRTDVPFSFNAYSATGTVMGDLVYVNHATQQDFDWLRGNHIDVRNQIVIARYGKTFRADMVAMAEKYGAAGMILYSDPKDYAPFGQVEVYPAGLYAPKSAVQLGTVFVDNGDPLTPLYPSTADAYRIKEGDANLPKIPVQPMGYEDAEKLLTLMGGPDPPADWKGGFKLPYKVGPGFKNRDKRVKLVVRTKNKNATIHNVIGTIRGSVEPDRYVLVGNHRDAWTFGAIDPSSATAAMMELSRVFGKLVKEENWRPRRTIIFCSWDAEEYGLIGSTEWVEENSQILSERAVAYLNVDAVMQGNFTLYVESVPLLYKAIYEATKLVPNPDAAEVRRGWLSIYDGWVRDDPARPGVDIDKTVPKINPLSASSDYFTMIHYLGVPSIDFRYRRDTAFDNLTAYPLYHTLYETAFMVEYLLDPGFKFHVGITRLWGEFLYVLCDSAVLPFDARTYASKIKDLINDTVIQYGAVLQTRGITLGQVDKAADEFIYEAGHFHKFVDRELDRTSPYAVRSVNDRLMQVERAFIEPRGLPDRPAYRHVIYAPSATDAYTSTYLCGLKDLIIAAETSANSTQADAKWEEVKLHISVLIYKIKSASAVLRSSLD